MQPRDSMREHRKNQINSASRGKAASQTQLHTGPQQQPLTISGFFRRLNLIV